MECLIIQVGVFQASTSCTKLMLLARSSSDYEFANLKPFKVCESYPESSSQTRSCKIVDCVVGKDVVKDTANDLRNKLKIQGKCSHLSCITRFII